MGLQAGVGQVVLAGGDHEHISGGIEQAQAEVVLVDELIAERREQFCIEDGRRESV